MGRTLAGRATFCLLVVAGLSAGVVSPAAGAQPDVAPAWTERGPATSPQGTYRAASAFDTARDRMVLFGGLVDDGLGWSRETWTWDGSDWQLRRPATAPPARYAAMMAYDPVRDEVLLFGGGVDSGSLADTWVFAGGEWTQRFPATSPSARSEATMAFDPNSQQIVMFGGFDGVTTDDTWAWNGVTWTELHPATSPPARLSSDLAYDPSRNALVLFGGWAPSGFLADTWTWDGATWAEETLRRSPGARAGLSMATFGHRVVLFGGDYFNDTWILRDKKWRNRTPAGSPSVRNGPSLEWDPARQEAVLFGGDYIDETWVLAR